MIVGILLIIGAWQAAADSTLRKWEAARKEKEAAKATIAILLAFTGRARVYAIIWFSVLAGVSYLLAPLVTEWLNTDLATRAVFFFPVVLGLLGLGAVSKYMAEGGSSLQTPRPDVIALAVWAGGICALIFGMIQAGTPWCWARWGRGR